MLKYVIVLDLLDIIKIKTSMILELKSIKKDLAAIAVSQQNSSINLMEVRLFHFVTKSPGKEVRTKSILVFYLISWCIDV